MTTNLLNKPDAAAAQADSATSAEGGTFLTFKLANEECGVEILKVRETIQAPDITTVPQMPVYMKGVINLRGKAIPVVDLRLKFGLEEIEYAEQTCIIVVDVGQEIGIIVDTAPEALDVPGENIEPPLSAGDAAGSSFILGIGKVGGAARILLDIDKVMTADELGDVVRAAEVH
jgi:purine-binding chemotaxis protein CheW